MYEGRIPGELAEFISEEIKNEGYELVDVLTKGGNSLLIEIVIDKAGGISIDECGDFNRRVSAWIDEKDLFPSGYTVDVCSPGLDRKLGSEREFKWAVGKSVEVTTHEPIQGKNKISGCLERIDDKGDLFIREVDGNIEIVARSLIARASLKFVLDKKARHNRSGQK